MSIPSLLIRADASPQIGTGHVMRCLALAQAWQDRGGTVTFACAQLGDALHARLLDEGIHVQQLCAERGSPEDAAQTQSLAENLQAAWVILDGYAFDEAYQRAVKHSEWKVLLLDDYAHLDHYVVDALLNQNSSATAQLYRSCAPQSDLLLGSRYALLRREFWRYRNYQRQTPEFAARILVTLGGADVDNLSERVINALNHIPHALEVRVIVGGSNPHRTRLIAAAERSPQHVTIAYDVTDMPRLMDWADAAITAAGSTLWEIALMGLPTLTITLADNQAEIASDMARRGATLDLGWGYAFNPAEAEKQIAALLTNREKRAKMSAVLQALVDGYGVERVIQFVLGITNQ